MRVALISGANGQDGSYLTELLLDRGYHVHGLVRRASSHNTTRIDHLLAAYPDRVTLHAGDVTDAINMHRVVQATAPDEVYNLAGQSDVAVSFQCPDYTTATNALGPLHLLEALRGSPARFYQASTSEMYGDSPAPQAEHTVFAPRSPYAVAKLAAYHTVRMYREAYGVYACNGILFNHESPRRSRAFVTAKICHGVARVLLGSTEPITLGNLDAMRDWGHARDMVRGMHMMLQMPDPDDYVLATGTARSVREFVNAAFKQGERFGAGRSLRLEWISDDTAILADTGTVAVAADPAMQRPLDVPVLRGDATKAARVLGWRPMVPFEDMVSEMIAAYLPRPRNDAVITPSGEIIACPP